MSAIFVELLPSKARVFTKGISAFRSFLRGRSHLEQYDGSCFGEKGGRNRGEVFIFVRLACNDVRRLWQVAVTRATLL